MKNFNWEEFKKGKFTVHCDTVEKAKDFLTMCDENGICWNSGVSASEYNKWDYYKTNTGYCCYSFESSLEYSPIEFYKENGIRITEWEIDNMKEEKKIYKIQDLYKEEFVGKKFKDINSSEIFTVVKSGNCLYVEELYGSLIEESYNMIDVLNMTFEPIEEEIKETNPLNKNSKIYIAGSLFNQGEVAQRKNEENALRQKGYHNIYNPINAPCNDKEQLPTSADIFWGDTNEILSSDMVIADISNATDLGTGCELGVIWACNHLHFLANEGLTLEEILVEMKKKKLIAHLSDIRKSTAHRYRGNNIPVGFNQYMIGLVEDTGVIKDNFKEVLDELKEDK